MRIAIITGGETGEREVSLKSAENVENSIDFAEPQVFIFPEDKSRFTEQVKDFDLVIPVIHGVGGEDGTLQARLKILGVPFIFSDVSTHSIAIDKKKTKQIAEEVGLLSPKESSSFPLFAKPNTGGSSLASRLCRSQEELNELIKNNRDIDFITEEPIRGREFTVGVIEYKGKTFALPVIEIIPKGAFFDFESKYNVEKLAQEVCPAQIEEGLARELQKQALAIHSQLEARHISRSDFIVTADEKVYFLEINTIPGLTNTSLIPKMLKEINLSLKDVLKEWCSENNKNNS